MADKFRTEIRRITRFVAAHALPVVLVLLRAEAGAAQQATDPSWNHPAPEPDRIVLTWSGDPTSSQSVTWRTDGSVTTPVAQVAIASPGPRIELDAVTVKAESQVVDTREVLGGGLLASYHSATFTGLQSDTIYAYRVGDGERWSEWFHFRTASREAKPFSFVYMGDAQNDILSLWSRVVRGSFAAAPDARFMIHAGDLVNTAHNDAQWGEWFRAGGWIHAMVPSVPAAGNHEYRATTAQEEKDGVRRLSAFWRPQFTLPRNGIAGQEETNYYLDYQGARIVVLNSNEAREEQALWLEKVLSGHNKPWTIVTFHHPLFSTAGERDNPELRALWKPIFDRHGVDLVLQGHDHTYARGRTAVERNATTGVNGRDETGTVYVVSVSGAKMYGFKPGQWNEYDASLDRRAENTQLFQVIRIDGDTLHYEARTATGAPYDAFELVRQGGDRPNRFIEGSPSGAPTRTLTSPPAYPR